MEKQIRNMRTEKELQDYLRSLSYGDHVTLIDSLKRSAKEKASREGSTVTKCHYYSAWADMLHAECREVCYGTFYFFIMRLLYDIDNNVWLRLHNLKHNKKEIGKRRLGRKKRLL